MTKVAQWVRDLTEGVLGPTPWKVGDRVKHPDGRTVQIISGQYWGQYGLSNHWCWREVLPNGELSTTEENGYGWKPVDAASVVGDSMFR